ncbi:MAG: hypothetical protein IPQ16_03630 [Geobacteraceae bacterium]|nr:hypothetical protein [Geobacteraceae bacterium]
MKPELQRTTLYDSNYLNTIVRLAAAYGETAVRQDQVVKADRQELVDLYKMLYLK